MASHLKKQSAKVFDIKAPTETLTQEDRIFRYPLRHSASCKDVGEIKFPSRFQDTEDFRKNPAFVGREIDHTVGNNQINGVVFDLKRFKILDITLQKTDVGLCVVKLLHLKEEMAPCHFQLFIGHIDANDLTIGANELGKDIGISSGA